MLSWEDQLPCSGLQGRQADKVPRDTSALVGRTQDGAGQRKRDQMLSVETDVKPPALWLEKENFSLVVLEQMLNQLEKRFALS